MVVRRINEDRVRKAILEASEGPEFRIASSVMDQIQRVAGDSDLVRIVMVDIDTTPVTDLQRAWRNAVAYPIKSDGTMSFDEVYFPPQ